MNQVEPSVTTKKEIELVEFYINKHIFAIDIKNINRILPHQSITQVPNSHPCLEGIFDFENTIVPVIDLFKYFNVTASEKPKEDKIMVTKLNNTFIGFHIGNVSKIYQITENDIQENKDSFFMQYNDCIIGTVTSHNYVSLVLDLEKIVVDL